MTKELNDERPGIDRRTILMAGGALAGGLALSAFTARPAAAAASGFGGAADAALARKTAPSNGSFHRKVVVWAAGESGAASHASPDFSSWSRARSWPWRSTASATETATSTCWC